MAKQYSLPQLRANLSFHLTEVAKLENAIKALEDMEVKTPQSVLVVPGTHEKLRGRKGTIPLAKLVRGLLKLTKRPLTYLEMLDKLPHAYPDMFPHGKVGTSQETKLLLVLGQLRHNKKLVELASADGSFVHEVRKKRLVFPEWVDKKGNLKKEFAKHLDNKKA